MWVDLLTDERGNTDGQKSFSSYVLKQPPMWLRERASPLRWTEREGEKKKSPLCLGLISQLINPLCGHTVCLTDWHHLAILDVMIFIWTCPVLLHFSDYLTSPPAHCVVFTQGDGITLSFSSYFSCLTNCINCWH